MSRLRHAFALRATAGYGGLAAALVAAFLMGRPDGAQAARCLTPEVVEHNVWAAVGDSLTVDEFGPQGLKAVIEPAYRAIYREGLRPADRALVFGSTQKRGPLAPEVLVVLFRQGCVVGWWPIPKQIYLRIVAGRAA